MGKFYWIVNYQQHRGTQSCQIQTRHLRLFITSNYEDEDTYKTKWEMSGNKETAKFKQKMEMANNVNRRDDVSDRSSQ